MSINTFGSTREADDLGQIKDDIETIMEDLSTTRLYLTKFERVLQGILSDLRSVKLDLIKETKTPMKNK